MPDYLEFIACVADAVRTKNCALNSMTLLSNHVHMMVVPGDESSLAEMIKRCAQRYAQKRNTRRGGSGKLFEERYFSIPINDEDHYATAHSYIDLNPIRAKIASHPSEYRWTTYHLHAIDGRSEWAAPLADLWTPSAWYLGLAREPARRAELYTTWIRECDDRQRRPPHAEQVRRVEEISLPYGRRLLRPDGSSAR